MFAETLACLSEWLEYISMYEEPDIEHFDRVQCIYNTINPDIKPGRRNIKYANTMTQFVENAFTQYKTCCENLDYEYQDARIEVIFENLVFTIERLGFSVDSDSDYVESESDEEIESDCSDNVVIKPRKTK